MAATTELKELSNDLIKDGDVDLLLFQVTNTDKGVSVYMKSPIIEEFFRANHTNQAQIDNRESRHFAKSSTPGWSDHIAYSLPPDTYHGGLERTTNWGGEFYAHGNGGANFAFLRAVGLKDGVTFDLEGLQSQSNIDNWILEFKETLPKIYSNWMKKGKKLVCTVSISEVKEV
jgi:hypothetical protein